MEEVEEICTRIAIVDHGKIIAEGTKEQLTSTITDTKDIWIGYKSDLPLDIESLQQIHGVIEVTADDQMIQIRSKSEVNNLNQLIYQLMAHEVEIRSVEEQAPNLETVFLTLTGRKLRD